MGEFSKRIGQVGEDVVADLLKAIGWTNTRDNFDIPSSDAEKHRKDSCGIDKYFHYPSPMISNTLEHIIISCKYSTQKYPNSPATTFKEYYYDLARALESFPSSSVNGEIARSYSNITGNFCRGVLFWLHNDSEGSGNIISKMAKTELEKGWSHDGVFVVDTATAEFLYDSVRYPLLKFKKKIDQQFIYFSTGLNNGDTNTKNGILLPVQMVNSNVLPLRIFDNESNETTIILTCSEPFERTSLINRLYAIETKF